MKTQELDLFPIDEHKERRKSGCVKKNNNGEEQRSKKGEVECIVEIEKK